MSLVHAIIQRFCWMILRVFTPPFVKLHIRGLHNLADTDYPVVIAANHKRSTDPFFIALSFPISARVFPIRFMAEDKHYDTPILELLRKTRVLSFVYFILGAFPSRRGEGLERALEIPKKILVKHENSVLIFPEGHRTAGDEIDEFKRGAAVLASDSHTPILPVAIRYRKREKRRLECSVSFGKNVSFSEQGNNPDETSKKIAHLVRELYKAA